MSKEVEQDKTNELLHVAVCQAVQLLTQGHNGEASSALRQSLVDYADAVEAKPDEPQPLDVILFCPACWGQHVDNPDPSIGWDNPPHRSHLCHYCAAVWRPSDSPTNGVDKISTKGTRDNWTPCDTRADVAAAETANVWQKATGIAQANGANETHLSILRLYAVKAARASPSTVPAERMSDDDLRKQINFHEAEALRLGDEISKVWRFRVRGGIATDEDKAFAAQIAPTAQGDPSLEDLAIEAAQFLENAVELGDGFSDDRSRSVAQVLRERVAARRALSTTTVAQKSDISNQAQRWPEGVRSSCCNAATVYHADGFECTACKKWCAGIERPSASEHAQRAADRICKLSKDRFDRMLRLPGPDEVAAIIQDELGKGEDERSE